MWQKLRHLAVVGSYMVPLVNSSVTLDRPLSLRKGADNYLLNVHPLLL